VLRIAKKMKTGEEGRARMEGPYQCGCQERRGNAASGNTCRKRSAWSTRGAVGVFWTVNGRGTEGGKRAVFFDNAALMP